MPVHKDRQAATDLCIRDTKRKRGFWLRSSKVLRPLSSIESMGARCLNTFKNLGLCALHRYNLALEKRIV